MGHRRSHRRISDPEEQEASKIQKQASDRTLINLKHVVSGSESCESDHFVHYRSKGVKKESERKRERHNIATRKRYKQRNSSYSSFSVHKKNNKQRDHEKIKTRKISGQHSRNYASDNSNSYSSSSISSDVSWSRSSSPSSSRSRKRPKLDQPDNVQDNHCTDHYCIKRNTGGKEEYNSLMEGIGVKDVKTGDEHHKSHTEITNRSQPEKLVIRHNKKDKNSEEAEMSKNYLGQSLLSSSSLEARRELKLAVADDRATEESAELDNGGSKVHLLEKQLREQALTNYMRYLDNELGQRRGKLTMGGEPKGALEDNLLRNDVVDRNLVEIRHMVMDAASNKHTENEKMLANHESDAHLTSQTDGHYFQGPATDCSIVSELSQQMESVKPQTGFKEGNICQRIEGDQLGNARRAEIEGEFDVVKEEISAGFTAKELVKDIDVIRKKDISQATNYTSLKPLCKTTASLCSEGTTHPKTSMHNVENRSVENPSSLAEPQETPKYEKPSGSLQDEAAMFQQKTMSVMRGGEVLQVNYKVYIPQRAAELAKRRLKR
eukprot:c26287_g1_i8 orf=280-1926(+)